MVLEGYFSDHADLRALVEDPEAQRRAMQERDLRLRYIRGLLMNRNEYKETDTRPTQPPAAKTKRA